MNKYKALTFLGILTAHAAVLASVMHLPHDTKVNLQQRIEVSLIQAPSTSAHVVQPQQKIEPPKKQQPTPEKIKTAAVAPTPVQPQVPTPAPAPAQETPVITEAAPAFDAAYLRNPIPAYPSISRRAGEEGKVLLRVLVDAHGMPTQIQLQKSSGFDRLDQAALTTVHQWKFVPAKRGEHSIEGWVIVPITFKLES
jgi:protein TonB